MVGMAHINEEQEDQLLMAPFVSTQAQAHALQVRRPWLPTFRLCWYQTRCRSQDPTPALASDAPSPPPAAATLPPGSVLAGPNLTIDVDVCTAASLEQYDDDSDLLLNFCMPATATLVELRSCMQVEEPGLDFNFRKARELATGKTVWVKVGKTNEASQLLSSFGSPCSATVFISIKRV